MEKSGFAVVFDTNSYRKLVTGSTTTQVLHKIHDIKALEERKNIKAFGIMVVGMEMLAHLADGVGAFNYQDCLNGVLAMGHHCFDKERNAPLILPQPYLHLTRAFFDTIPSEIESRAKNMAGVVDDLRQELEKSLKFHNEKGTFRDIRDYIQREESNFSTQIVDLIKGAEDEILKKHPKIEKRDLRLKLLDYIQNGPFEPYVALAMMIAVSITLNIQLPQEETIKRAFAMNLEFPLSVGFYSWICHKIVHDGIDMTSKASKEKRWNWLWDYQVSFLISPHTIDNREIILVTSDGDIIEMLKTFGYENRVMTITEYQAFLKDI